MGTRNLCFEQKLKISNFHLKILSFKKLLNVARTCLRNDKNVAILNLNIASSTAINVPVKTLQMQMVWLVASAEVV